MASEPTLASAPDAEPTLGATLRDALRGVEHDLTTVSLPRSVLLVAVPMMLEMSMESLLTVVDIFFVAKLGERAVATVGLTEAMLAPIYALAMGLSAGATALVARRTGEKNHEAAARSAGQVLLTAVVSSVVAGLVGALVSRPALALMGASPDVLEYGARYTALMFAGTATIFLLYVINAVFRAAGAPALAMRSLWLANALNLVLCPLFVFGLGPVPAMGVFGAAVATTLGRGVGVVYQLYLLRRGVGSLRVTAAHLAPQRAELRELAQVSSSAALGVLVETASWLGLVRILSSFGSAALAGYTIAMRVAIFALLPSWGLAGSAATLVGQNLGAGSVERAKQAVRVVARYNVAFLGVIGLALLAFAPWLVRLFSEGPAVTAFGAECLRLVSLGFFFFAYGMVAVQAFNGAGDTATPMLVNVGCFWLLKIPLAYVLARHTALGPRGVFVAITVAYTAQALLAGALFRRGRWQRASPAATTPEPSLAA